LRRRSNDERVYENETAFCGLFHDTKNSGVARSGHLDGLEVFDVNAGIAERMLESWK
jgi:hypothetical protein